MAHTNNSPLISVIIPYYNPKFDYFKEAIESILSQSYSNWEVIIVDDGSTDKSKECLRKYIGSLASGEISIVYLDKNYGPSVARNKGIELAKGDIITFLDSDDLYLPWFCEKIVERFNKDPNCLILLIFELYYLLFWKVRKVYLTKAQLKLIEGEFTEEYIIEKFKNGQLPSFPRLVAKKKIFEKVKFDPRFRAGEDTDLLLQLISSEELFKNLKIANFVGYLYRFYSCKSRLTYKPELKFLVREMLIEKHNGTSPSIANKVLRGLEGYLSFSILNKFLKEYFSGDYLFGYLWNVFSKCSSATEKIKGVKTLIKVICDYKFLIPVFGIDSGYLNLFFNKKNNGTKRIKEMFIDHVKGYKDESAKCYALELVEKIF